MTAKGKGADLAARVAASLRTDGPWEVVGESARRFELHLQGSRVEIERGPLTVEGYGIRLFRPRGAGLGTGFQASTDRTPEGIAATLQEAEETSLRAEFPAKSIALPSASGGASAVAVLDPKLWDDPLGSLRAYVETVLGHFDGRKDIVPSFGSVKATLAEISLTNSEGLNVQYPETHVDFELAVKAFGGPEGRPPGEFWVNESSRRLQPELLGASVEEWCRHAADVRVAVPPPTGDLPVILTAGTLSEILPLVLGARLSGGARLRKLAPEPGSVVGVEALTIRDEGDYPWAPGSSPYDDEGVPRRRTTLVDHGKVGALLYDSLHAAAFDTPSTGSAFRTTTGPTAGLKFAHAPGPATSTAVVQPGDGGSLEEVAAAAGDGVLVTQLGWAFPDPVSSAFGGEIRIGYRIRGGKLAEPVRGGTVGGIVFAPVGERSTLASIAAIGGVPEASGRVVSPPLLVRPLTVAGATA